MSSSVQGNRSREDKESRRVKYRTKGMIKEQDVKQSRAGEDERAQTARGGSGVCTPSDTLTQ